ncbi:MAG TPA: hypothetical protein P5555_15805 [Candidatus Paceibacterota bacterium]|nr:hypothetical protein [Verrucomicrobiota bacterium]HRZ46648.1 hypothetical protein [Candidatus Paceibacterota bacterium]HRZ91292.1 hypothetical protein [Candidatus Paceibacterota bacterium]
MTTDPKIRPESKNRRECPALNAIIGTAECGQQRGSKLSCPAHCPHFPFGTASYDLWLKVDGAWTRKALDFAVRKVGPDRLRRILRQNSLDPTQDLDVDSLPITLEMALFREPRADGRTLADVWEAEGWSGLNNDERVMTQCRRKSFAAVLEVQRIVDDVQTICQDMHAPESAPFTVFDRTLAGGALRFSRFLGWIAPYPHYYRVAGLAVMIPHLTFDVWWGIIQDLFQKAAAQKPGLAWSDFLMGRFASLIALNQQIVIEHRRQMIESMDMNQCAAEYRLAGDAQPIIAVLDAKPECSRQSEEEQPGSEPAPLAHWTWFQQGESEAFVQAPVPSAAHSPLTAPEPKRILGSLRLYSDRLVLSTFTKRRYEFLRPLLEKWLGSHVVFEKETVVDLARKYLEEQEAREALEEAQGPSEEEPVGADAEPGDDSALDGSPQDAASAVPEEERHHVLEQALRNHYTRLLDDAIPALENQTPRAAAKNPDLRPRLVRLLKDHIHQIQINNQRDGTRLNLDWVLDELGVPELK